MIGLPPVGFSFVIIVTVAPKPPENSGRIVLSVSAGQNLADAPFSTG